MHKSIESYTLDLHSENEWSDITLIDSNNQLVCTEIGSFKKELPKGIYTIYAENMGRVKKYTLKLECSKKFTIDNIISTNLYFASLPVELDSSYITVLVFNNFYYKIYIADKNNIAKQFMLRRKDQSFVLETLPPPGNYTLFISSDISSISKNELAIPIDIELLNNRDFCIFVCLGTNGNGALDFLYIKKEEKYKSLTTDANIYGNIFYKLQQKNYILPIKYLQFINFIDNPLLGIAVAYMALSTKEQDLNQENKWFIQKKIKEIIFNLNDSYKDIFKTDIVLLELLYNDKTQTQTWHSENELVLTDLPVLRIGFEIIIEKYSHLIKARSPLDLFSDRIFTDSPITMYAPFKEITEYAIFRYSEAFNYAEAIISTLDWYLDSFSLEIVRNELLGDIVPSIIDWFFLFSKNHWHLHKERFSKHGVAHLFKIPLVSLNRKFSFLHFLLQTKTEEDISKLFNLWFGRHITHTQSNIIHKLSKYLSHDSESTDDSYNILMMMVSSDVSWED